MSRAQSELIVLPDLEAISQAAAGRVATLGPPVGSQWRKAQHTTLSIMDEMGAAVREAFAPAGVDPSWPAPVARALGRPLADVHGRLVGINTMMSSPEVGLAVLVHGAKAFLCQALGS